MFSRLPTLAISLGVRKPRPTSMARSCSRLFAHRLALSSGIWTAYSSTPTHSPHPVYSLRAMLRSVRKPVAHRILMSRISQRSCCCDMNMFRPCPALKCPFSVDDLRK